MWLLRFPSNIVGSLSYSVKHIETTVVVNWCYTTWIEHEICCSDSSYFRVTVLNTVITTGTALDSTLNFYLLQLFLLSPVFLYFHMLLFSDCHIYLNSSLVVPFVVPHQCLSSAAWDTLRVVHPYIHFLITSSSGPQMARVCLTRWDTGCNMSSVHPTLYAAYKMQIN